MNRNQLMPAKFVRKTLPAAMALVFGHAAWAGINDSGNIAAMPTGGVATSNVTNPTLTSNSLSMDVSGRAVINWSTFNIGSGYTVTFNGAGGAVLNKVPLGNVPGTPPGTTAPNSSTIGGALNAPGVMVLLMNPNGVLFTSTASVNVGSLVATTGRIDESEFTNHGKVMIDYPAGYPRAGVVNQGQISVEAAGLAALVAPSVVNEGVIVATGGQILLAGTDVATITMNGGLYEFAVAGSGGNVTNAAGASLSGATILLSTGDASGVLSGTINLAGIQNATGAIVVDGGTVVLKSDLNAPALAGGSRIINVYNGAHIQDAVDIAANGATVNVRPGDYSEVAAGRQIGPGTYELGLFIDKENLTLRGVNAAGNPITSADGVQAWITAGATTNFGMNHGVVADGVTVEGLGFKPYAADPNKTIEIAGDNFTFRNSVVDNRTAVGGAGALYFGELLSGPGGEITKLTVTGSKFLDGSVSLQNGVGVAADGVSYQPAADRVISGNTFIGSANYRFGGLLLTGKMDEIPWRPLPIGAASISGNSFSGFDESVMVRGDQQGVDLRQVMAQNTFDRSVLVTDGAGNARGEDYASRARNSDPIVMRPKYSIQSSIQSGINRAVSGDTVKVGAGNYAEILTIGKALTLSGQAGAKVVVADGAEVNGVTISANNVTVSGLEIAGPVSSSYLTYPWANITRGVVVQNGVTGFNISNNNIHDLRTGILIDGRNGTGNSVTGNTIENTKSGISVQYTDATGITISGNTQGPIGNEWGLNLHLNGYFVGVVHHDNPLAAAPTLTGQQSLLALSATNGGWSVQDQGYTSSNRTHVNVKTTGSDTNQGSALTPLGTIRGGISAVVVGGKVNVAPGTYVQGTTLYVDKSVTLMGAGQSGDNATIIDARGVTNNYGISVSADNVTLSDFTVYGPAAFFSSAYGIKVSPGGPISSRLHNFTIRNVTSRGAGKAELDLNGVIGATIDSVTADGTPYGGGVNDTTEGAGIQITDSADVTIANSTTRNNRWGGIAIYQANKSYDQQVDNITVQANNSLGEKNPLYLQDESSSKNFGALNLLGFDYAVRNPTTVGTAPNQVIQSQYTWMQKDLQKAYDFAVDKVASPETSYIQGWSGTGLMQDFYVGVGNLERSGTGTRAMSIGQAIAAGAAGSTVHVGPGTFNEIVSLNVQRNLLFDNSTINGLAIGDCACGSGIGGTATANGAGGFFVDAQVDLLRDTSLATTGANIVFNGDIQGSGGNAYALSLNAGSGNVTLVSGGTASHPIGKLSVTSNNFTLLSTLWVSGYDINALGTVALSDHTLRSVGGGVTNEITAGGDVTGNTVAESPVDVQSGGDVIGSYTAPSITVAAQETVSIVVNAPGPVEVHSEGPANVTGSAPSVIIDAPSGSVSGDFGQVTNTGSGLIDVNGKPQVNTTIAGSADNLNRVIPAEITTATSPDAAGPQRGGKVRRRKAEDALEVLDNGEALEIDLTPG